MFSEFFIERPVFATVIAIIILIVGGASIPLLPVTQFPLITPPTVQVSATYTGASAETVEHSVTTPLEEQINGVDGMIYMSSSSADDGSSIITVTFEIGYDVDIGAVDVQNRMAVAQSQLPDEVQREGLSVQKTAPFVTLCMNLLSPDGRYDDLFLSNYASIHLVDALSRIRGVGDVTLFGERTYAMRVWLDPDKLAALNLTAGEIADAITAQNVQVPAGAIGAAPAPQGLKTRYTVTTLGRLTEVSQFEDIIVRAQPDGRILRLRDVARVELGAEDYSELVRLNDQETINICLFEQPGGNSLDIASEARALMAQLAERFPDGMTYTIIYDTTRFVRQSIREVVWTLLEAMGLVILVIIAFLRNWRATLIPAITIPVSLIGTFAVLNALGFSINTLTLFGLVLAVGLVVDDAIVVVENVSRQLETRDTSLSLRDAARIAMQEVTNPIIATTLVLMAVFVPVAFIPGVSGQLYRQFALTIACAVGISAINALTLSPALCATFLRRPRSRNRPGAVSHAIASGFNALVRGYEHLVQSLIRFWPLVLAIYALLVGATGYMLVKVPTGFVPNEDQGYFMVSIDLPQGASLERTIAVQQRMYDVVSKIPGVENIIEFAGYSFISNTSASNQAFMFPILKDWSARTTPEEQIGAIMDRTRKELATFNEAKVGVFNPPSVHGLSATGGFQFELQDLAGGGLHQLGEVAETLVRKAEERPELTGLFETFSADTPTLYVDIDRNQVMTQGVDLTDVFDALQTFLGGLYVNEFNKFGRVYRVYLQAEDHARAVEEDIGRYYVRNSAGDMVPLSALVTVKPSVTAFNILHYNLFRSISINGAAAVGYSSGQAIAAMEEVAREVLPAGYSYEWTGTTFQQIKAGNQAVIIFVLALVFVFLFLAALYESWSLPFTVMLAVPLAILGALTAQWTRGLENDVYCQIGLVMLIGLASKNAILIVQFAKQRREEGLSIEEAAMEAARIRLRPILMTAFAFILGVVPLVIATGAGSNARHSLGTAVFGGMIVSTLLSLLLVPVLYVLIERLRARRTSATPESTPSP